MLESSLVATARLRRWWPVGAALGILACLLLPRLPTLAPGLPLTATLRPPPALAPTALATVSAPTALALSLAKQAHLKLAALAHSGVMIFDEE